MNMLLTNTTYTLLIAFSLISCSSYKMLDGKSHAVYFTADTSVFNDFDFPDPKISYQDLRAISTHSMNEVALRKSETIAAVIAYPTFFQAYSQFLVYPGEHIIVKKGIGNEYLFLNPNGSEQRNRELSFFKVFSEKTVQSKFAYLPGVSFDTVLDLESKIKEEIPGLEKRSRLIFDSLIHALNVSRKFKKLTSGYSDNKGWINLYSFYEQNKDTLLSHGVYKEKYVQLVSGPFSPSRKPQIISNSGLFTQLSEKILPHKIKDMESSADFAENFDTIDTLFKGFARDFLLSQLIYMACTKKIDIPEPYLEKYDSISKETELKKVLNNLRKSQQIADKKAIKSGNNGLLELNSNKVTSIEKVLSENKGKVIVLDFWASWCVPCLEDEPLWDSLKQQFKKDAVVFLKISLDREVQKWRKAVISMRRETKNNYLLINSTTSEFYKKYQINAIPRYMLINRLGNIIDTDAPRLKDLNLRSITKI